MGFFGHLIASRAAPGTAFPDAEPEPGDWAPGLHVWLHLDGFVSHFVLPRAPFDEAGNPLPEDVAAEQDAEWERMAAAYAEQVRALGLAGDAAAEACRAWACASGLKPAPVDVVRAALETHEVHVEDTFVGLLRTLGA
jgi:hypothetical protein